jgi:hypothetical protein
MRAARPWPSASRSWGPLKVADVQLGEEKATGLTIQLIGESTYAMPASCTGTAITDVQTLGSNGVLGVGIWAQDCGLACALSARAAANPGAYYACASPTGGCAVASVPASQQVSHPVASFPADNNGLIIQLPNIDARGAPQVQGQLIFGIGTQDNNGLGTAALVGVDGYGFASAEFPVGGTAYDSYIDSGSNCIFLLNSADTGLRQCTGVWRNFYCPSTTTNFTATLAAPDGTQSPFDFSVANADTFPLSAFAFNDLAGPMPGYPNDPTVPGISWGLPFFYGRSVFTAIEERATPAGPGPYIAF